MVAPWREKCARERTCRVPRAEDDAAVGRIVLDLDNDLCELVDALPRVVIPARLVLCAKVPPLEAVREEEMYESALLDLERGEASRI